MIDKLKNWEKLFDETFIVSKHSPTARIMVKNHAGKIIDSRRANKEDYRNFIFKLLQK